jgi:hypothetical protein
LYNALESQAGHEVYIYTRAFDHSKAAAVESQQLQVTLPGRQYFGEATINVGCDKCFISAINTVISGVRSTREVVQSLVHAATVSAPSQSLRGDNAHNTASASATSSKEPAKPVVVLLNATRANKLDKIRADYLEKQSGAIVITAKLESSLPEVQHGRLAHVHTDYRTPSGIRKIMDKVIEHGFQTPYAVILDYMELVCYSAK